MISTPIFFHSKMPSIVRHGIVLGIAFVCVWEEFKKEKETPHAMYQLIVRHILNPE